MTRETGDRRHEIYTNKHGNIITGCEPSVIAAEGKEKYRSRRARAAAAEIGNEALSYKFVLHIDDDSDFCIGFN